MTYGARYYGTHCDLQITVTGYDIAEGTHPLPVLDDYKCPTCKTLLPLVLIEVGTELSDLDDNLFDDEEAYATATQDHAGPHDGRA